MIYKPPTFSCLAFDFPSKKLGTVDITGVATVLTDLLTDTLYYVKSDTVFAAFSGFERRVATYKTGRITLPAQAAVAWVAVFGDQSSSNPVTVQWYGDGELRHTATFTDIKPQRLPPGRWLEHEVVVTSDARVTSVVLAGSLAELQAV